MQRSVDSDQLEKNDTCIRQVVVMDENKVDPELIEVYYV